VKPKALIGWNNRRRVWSAVTARPQATVRELAAMTGISSSDTVHDHLCFLRAAGYIDFQDSAERARRIIIPCGVQR
jgi:hypothetical protein